MDYEIVGILDSLLGTHRAFGRGEHYYYCPFCHHHNPKLAVNLVNRRWHCWTCNAAGRSLLSLVRRLDVSPEIRIKLATLLADEYATFKTAPGTEVPTLTLPSEFEPMLPHPSGTVAHKALKYLQSRGLTDRDIARYNIGYCRTGLYAGRVIVPSYDAAGTLTYFIGRTVFDDARSYTNPPISKNIIGFENEINWDFPIVLVEGVFDAMSTKRNAIPLLGKTLPKKLREKILSQTVNEIYLALDNDAMKYTLKHAEKFLKEGKTVYIVQLNGKDPSELGFKQMQKLIRDATPLTFAELIKHQISLI